MAHEIKRFVLTPSQAAEKALIVEQIRLNSPGPWINSKKTTLPKSKEAAPAIKKKI